MRSYKLYLLRHGMTESNRDGRYIGVTDVDLSPEGAAELVKLNETAEYPAVGKIYASPLKRCIQTAKLLYPEMTVNTVEELKEYNFGAYENKTMAQLKEDEEFLHWMEHGAEVTPPGGENPEAFSRRIREGFDRVIKDMMAHKISAAAVVTHGGVLMSILSMCGLPRRKPSEWMVESGHGYSILVNASLWGNTSTFEVCDELPYREQEEFEQKTYDLLDVEELREQARRSDC